MGRTMHGTLAYAFHVHTHTHTNTPHANASPPTHHPLHTTQQQLQQLSVVPPITIVLLLSAMSRFKVQPSSAMLDTVAVYCRDAGALRHTNTEVGGGDACG